MRPLEQAGVCAIRAFSEQQPDARRIKACAFPRRGSGISSRTCPPSRAAAGDSRERAGRSPKFGPCALPAGTISALIVPAKPNRTLPDRSSRRKICLTRLCAESRGARLWARPKSRKIAFRISHMRDCMDRQADDPSARHRLRSWRSPCRVHLSWVLRHAIFGQSDRCQT